MHVSNNRDFGETSESLPLQKFVQAIKMNHSCLQYKVKRASDFMFSRPPYKRSNNLCPFWKPEENSLCETARLITVVGHV